LFVLTAILTGVLALATGWRRVALTNQLRAGTRHETPVPGSLQAPKQSVSTPHQLTLAFNTRVYWALIGAMIVLVVGIIANTAGSRLGFMFVLMVAAFLKRPQLLAATAVGLMEDSARRFHASSEFWELNVPTMLMLLSASALWMSMLLDWQPIRIPALPIPRLHTPSNLRLRGIHVVMILLGLVALGELIRINIIGATDTLALATSIDIQHALLIAGIVFLVLGLGRVRFYRRLPAIQWKTLLPILAIMGLALGLRFYELGNIKRYFIDELFFADNVRLLREWRNVSLTAPFDGTAAEPLLFPYWQSITVAVFGRNLMGLRAASAIIGTLTVGATYLLGRSLFDKKTALVAALLLATFPPHIHFSRIGLSEIAMTLFGTLALAFLSRGVIKHRPVDFALGGAMLGLTHYFHEGGKYLFTPLAVLWLGAIWLLYRPRLSLKYCALALVVCLLVALPIYTTLLATHKPLAARMVSNAAGLSGDYWQQLFQSGNFSQYYYEHLLPPFLLYIQGQDVSFFYGGDTPLTLSVLTPVLLLGVFYVLRRVRSPGSILLVFWVLATSVGNSFLVQSDGAARFVVVFPGLTLLAAVGVRYTFPLLFPEFARDSLMLRWQRFQAATQRHLPLAARVLPPAPQPITLVLAPLVIGFALMQANYYFNQHLPLYNEQTRDRWGHRDAQDAILRSLNFPPGTHIHIVTQTDPPNLEFTSGVLNFLVDGLDVNTLSVTDFTPEYLASLDHQTDNAFYIGPYNTQAISLLRANITLLPPQLSPFDLPADDQFVLYYAPASNPTPSPLLE
jgi:4-amino-4-deoxy-L-arabinose transferase-like glycosyltransferase